MAWASWLSADSAHGLAALLIAPGRGGKPKYTSEQKARILAEVQRVPDRLEDQTATWSLLLLRDALRKTALPHIAKETIRQVLHEHGYSFQRTRTKVSVRATRCANAKAAP